MKFILTGVVQSLFKQGQGKAGPWYLYKVQANDGKYTKTWTLFHNNKLGIGDTYEFEGRISDSPNKQYKNDEGKHPYTTTFNITAAALIGMAGSNVFNNEEPPTIDTNSDIPF